MGLGARIANFVFGSPSIRRANGLRGGMSSGAKWPFAQASKAAETPVFAVDYPLGSHPGGLPRVWFTEPAYDATGGCVRGRELIGSYPHGADVEGRRALRHAQAYFAEALRYSREEDLELRRDCFRAAEILYLHAAKRGSVEASLKLACIYEADLCEGRYWNWSADAQQPCRMGALPLQARAFECFSFAAVRGCAEACWHLGDMLMGARGCSADASRANALYQRAYDLANAAGDAEAAGNAALRLGRAYEGGVACERSLKRALAWYRIAADCLELALSQGAWHYKKPCHEARMGLRRIQQELIGRY